MVIICDDVFVSHLLSSSLQKVNSAVMQKSPIDLEHIHAKCYKNLDDRSFACMFAFPLNSITKIYACYFPTFSPHLPVIVDVTAII